MYYTRKSYFCQSLLAAFYAKSILPISFGFYNFVQSLVMFAQNLGEKSYTHGDMHSVQYGAVIGQVNLAHQLPSVSGLFASVSQSHIILEWQSFFSFIAKSTNIDVAIFVYLITIFVLKIN